MISAMAIDRSLTKLALIGAAILLVASTGCRRQPPPPKTKTYAFKGVVVAKSPDNELSVTNENIPGFMPPMTMNYRVKDPEGFKAAQVGDSIGANLLVTVDTSDYWLEHVNVLRAARPGQPPLDLSPRSPGVGMRLPDVPMRNQDGRMIRLSQFHGQAVLLTFIYTRCPLPNYCPLMTSHFAEIERNLARDPRAYARTHLLTISLDPTYDTPAVLRTYALAYLGSPAGFRHWDFASPSVADLKKLADALGLFYRKDGAQISHSMDTVLIGPDGTIAKSWLDNRWQVKEVQAALVAAAQPSSAKPKKVEG